MKKRVVLKFGGTSVASPDLIKNVALHVQQEVRQGNEVAVVVSAMAGVTNQLVEWAHQIGGPHVSTSPDYDTVLSSGEQVTSGLLSLALQKLGIKSRSWQGWQLPIKTNEIHGYARILHIETREIQKSLKEGFVAVISGFQGVTSEGRITTLGRGGSDTSAVALAAALQANRCDIYTDVEGVYTADPRLVPRARKLDRLTYEEMLELASQGAKVLQTRSVELAMKEKICLRVLSTFVPGSGTLIVYGDKKEMEEERISGLAYEREEASLTLRGIPFGKGGLGEVVKLLSQEQIPLDMIIQSGGGHGSTGLELTFTVPGSRLQEALTVLSRHQDQIGFTQMIHDGEVSKVSIIGIGLKSHPRVMEHLLRILAQNHIEPALMVTSETKISVLIQRIYLELALRALHSAYGLDGPSASSLSA